MKQGHAHIIHVNDGDSKNEFVIEKDEFTLGRSKKADICIPDQHLSSLHLKIKIDENENYWITDLGSTNGTFLEDKKLNANETVKYFIGQKISTTKQSKISINIAQQLIEIKKVVNGNIDLPSTVVKKEEKIKPLAIVPNDFDEIKAEYEKLKTKKDFLYEDVLEIEEKIHALKKKEKEMLQALKETEFKHNDFVEKNQLLEIELASLTEKFKLEEEKKHLEIQNSLETIKNEVSLIKEERDRLYHKKKTVEDEYFHSLEEKEKMEKEFALLKGEFKTVEERHFLLSRENNQFLLEEQKIKENMSKAQSDLFALNEKSLTLIRELKEKEEKTEHECKVKTEESNKLLKDSQLHFEEKSQEVKKILNEAKDIKENAEQYAINLQKDLITSAQKEKENILKIAKEQATHIEQENKAIIENLKIEISKLIEKSNILKNDYELEKEKLKQETEKALKLKIEEQKAIIEKMKMDCSQEIEKKKANAKAELESMFINAQNEIKTHKDQIFQLESDANQFLLEAKIEASAIIKKAESEAFAIMKAKDSELLKIKDEIAHNLKQRDHIIEDAKKENEELKKESQTLLALAKKDAEKIVHDANEQSDKLCHETLLKTETFNNETKIQNEKLILETQKKIESELNAHKINFEQMINKDESDFNAKRLVRAQNLSTTLANFIEAELEKIKAQAINNQTVLNLKKNTQILAIDIILEKESDESSKLKSLFAHKNQQEEDSKQFNRKFARYLIPPLALFILLLLLPSIVIVPRNSIISFFNPKDEQKHLEQLQKEMAEHNKAPVYTPLQTQEFKDSYVDNLLFTKEYFKNKSEQKYHDKWILELSDFFVYKFDLKDTVIIKYVSMEAKLIRDLKNVQKEIDPGNPEIKIKEMRELETKFKQSLREILGDDMKVQKTYDFNKQNWNEFFKNRTQKK